jgi:PAS domain S-box-containing protein
MDTSSFFELLFINAKQNGMLIMSEEGIVQKVNEAFTTAYGYTTEDLKSKHFRILYIEKDQLTRRPELELETTLREGSSTDENYLVHKDGTPVWVTGEAIRIKAEKVSCIVKVIHNIHAQKQLERYLLASADLLDSLFDSLQQTALLLLDSQMKIKKANKVFMKMFNIQNKVTEGSRLQQLEHPFWNEEEIKNDIRNVIVNNETLKKEFSVDNSGIQKLEVIFKLILSEKSMEKNLLLIIKEA